MSELASGFEGK